MAFVTCEQHKKSQDAQDTKIETLEQCCETNKTKNDAQDAEIEKIISGTSDKKIILGVDRNGVNVLQGSCFATCEDYNDLDKRLKQLASENSSLKSENNGLRSQVSDLNSQLSSCQSSLASCRSSSGGNLSLVQQGKLLFNASLNRSNRKHNGWSYGSLRISDVSGGKASGIESVKYQVKAKTYDDGGLKWFPDPHGETVLQPDQETAYYSHDITLYARDSHETSHNRNNIEGNTAFISEVPINPEGAYGGTYYNIVVTYKDGKSYPAGDILDISTVGFNPAPDTLQRPW